MSFLQHLLDRAKTVVGAGGTPTAPAPAAYAPPAGASFSAKEQPRTTSVR